MENEPNTLDNHDEVIANQGPAHQAAGSMPEQPQTEEEADKEKAIPAENEGKDPNTGADAGEEPQEPTPVESPAEGAEEAPAEGEAEGEQSA